MFEAKKNAQFVETFSGNTLSVKLEDSKSTFWSDIAGKWSFVRSLV